MRLIFIYFRLRIADDAVSFGWELFHFQLIFLPVYWLAYYFHWGHFIIFIYFLAQFCPDVILLKCHFSRGWLSFLDSILLSFSFLCLFFFFFWYWLFDVLAAHYCLFSAIHYLLFLIFFGWFAFLMSCWFLAGLQLLVSLFQLLAFAAQLPGLLAGCSMPAFGW